MSRAPPNGGDWTDRGSIDFGWRAVHERSTDLVTSVDDLAVDTRRIGCPPAR